MSYRFQKLTNSKGLLLGYLFLFLVKELYFMSFWREVILKFNGKIYFWDVGKPTD